MFSTNEKEKKNQRFILLHLDARQIHSGWLVYELKKFSIYIGLLKGK